MLTSSVRPHVQKKIEQERRAKKIKHVTDTAVGTAGAILGFITTYLVLVGLAL